MNATLDLRQTTLYQEVRDFFTALHAPGDACITDASDLSATPDGRYAALTGTIFLDLEHPPITRIGVLELDTGQLQVQSCTQGNDRLPRYSPDGRNLAFLSDRAQSGNFQLFLANADGTHVEAMPPLDGVVETLAWSRDGLRLLLGVAGFGADIAGAQGGSTTVRKPVDLPDWAPAIDTGDADNLWRTAYMFDLPTRQYERASPHGLNIWECNWLSEHELVAVVSDSHTEGSWYESRLVAIALGGASHHTLYQPTVQIGGPVASPRGTYVAVIEATCSDRLIVCGDVQLLDRRTGTARRLNTGRVDVTQVIWRDEDTLVFVGHRGLETGVGEIDIPLNTCRESWANAECTFGAWYPSIELHPRGGILGVAESYAVAPQIVHIDATGCRVVHSFATRASAAPGFNTARIEPITWSARDGLEIQGWLVRPPGIGPFPLVMDVHGGPVWACRNRWQGRLRGAKLLADHGIASLYPNPRGSSGRGAEFARLVKGDMGGEDTFDYLSAVDALVARRIADPARLGVTGISYGGFMSAWLVTQDPRFAAAVPISPVANWYSQHRTSQIPYFDSLFLDGQPAASNGLYFTRSPVMYANRVRTPVLQLTGALDQNTPPTQALEFHRSLLEQGVRSVLATYPTAGHGIRAFPAVIDATARYVGWFLEHFEHGRL
jgi:dipeptidyl aminopeptidase/acylaminoacyl peptidase